MTLPCSPAKAGAQPLKSIARGSVYIGAMGLAMARNLHAKAYPLLVRDIAPQAVAEAAALGIEACDTPAALAARCDVLRLTGTISPEIASRLRP